jgi:uncharacterized membrane-anchored protein
MNQRIRYVLFGVLCLVQIAVPATMVVEHQRTIAAGKPWRFQTAPVDPNDPFRGRYVRLGFAAARDAIPMANSGMIYIAPDTRMYAELAAGSDGFAHLVRLHEERPAGGDYLDVFVRNMRSPDDRKDKSQPAAAFVRLPFDRYYLPEDRAQAVEREYAEAARGARDNTYAEVRVRAGHAALTALVLNGNPVR